MFHRRSQPKFPGTFKMVDFQSFFFGGGLWERRNEPFESAPLAAAGLRNFFSRPDHKQQSYPRTSKVQPSRHTSYMLQHLNL